MKEQDYPEVIKDRISSIALKALIEIAFTTLEQDASTRAKYAVAEIEDVLNIYNERNET